MMPPNNPVQKRPVQKKPVQTKSKIAAKLGFKTPQLDEFLSGAGFQEVFSRYSSERNRRKTQENWPAAKYEQVPLACDRRYSLSAEAWDQLDFEYLEADDVWGATIVALSQRLPEFGAQNPQTYRLIYETFLHVNNKGIIAPSSRKRHSSEIKKSVLEALDEESSQKRYKQLLEDTTQQEDQAQKFIKDPTSMLTPAEKIHTIRWENMKGDGGLSDIEVERRKDLPSTREKICSPEKFAWAVDVRDHLRRLFKLKDFGLDISSIRILQGDEIIVLENANWPDIKQTQRQDLAEIQTKILQGCFDDKPVVRYHRQMNEAEKLEFHKNMMDSNSLDWHHANSVSRETQMTNRALGERTSEEYGGTASYSPSIYIDPKNLFMNLPPDLHQKQYIYDNTSNEEPNEEMNVDEDNREYWISENEESAKEINIDEDDKE